jgi:hypothetical protein
MLLHFHKDQCRSMPFFLCRAVNTEINRNQKVEIEVP